MMDQRVSGRGEQKWLNRSNPTNPNEKIGDGLVWYEFGKD